GIGNGIRISRPEVQDRRRPKNVRIAYYVAFGIIIEDTGIAGERLRGKAVGIKSVISTKQHVIIVEAMIDPYPCGIARRRDYTRESVVGENSGSNRQIGRRVVLLEHQHGCWIDAVRRNDI